MKVVNDAKAQDNNSVFSSHSLVTYILTSMHGRAGYEFITKDVKEWRAYMGQRDVMGKLELEEALLNADRLAVSCVAF